ncbi:hypothetical protein [Metapseudomonas sp. CR1201]
MASEREIALEQAFVALLTEARDQGVDLNGLLPKVEAGLLGNATYRWVGAEHVSASIDAAHEIVGRIAR